MPGSHPRWPLHFHRATPRRLHNTLQRVALSCGSGGRHAVRGWTSFSPPRYPQGSRPSAAPARCPAR